MNIRERIVWSPENGGCLMIQRKTSEGWANWGSQEEGEYPKYNAQARRAVRMANAWRRQQAIMDRVKSMEERAAVLRSRAFEICRKAGISANSLVTH